MGNCSEHNHCCHGTIHFLFTLAGGIAAMVMIVANIQKLSRLLHTLTKEGKE